MLKTHTCGELNLSNVGQHVTLAGWVNRRRDHGGLIFIDVRDRFGLTQITVDAEGAAHEISIEVVGAASESDALTVGREIARSNLFKCAIFGGDPNWGRVLSAIGVTHATFDPDALDVSFNGIQICRAGGIGEPRELVDLRDREVSVVVDLHAGDRRATIWTTDLTYDYVRENAEYST